jgi:hypothetical protein
LVSNAHVTSEAIFAGRPNQGCNALRHCTAHPGRFVEVLNLVNDELPSVGMRQKAGRHVLQFVEATAFGPAIAGVFATRNLDISWNKKDII